MRKTPSRDRFKNSSQKPEEFKNANLFEEILSTDMDYVPDYDTDLSHVSIIKDSAVGHWFKKLSDNSQNVYGRALEQYCLYWRMTPKQLLNEAINSTEKIPDMRQHIIKLNSFCDFIESEGYEQIMSDGTEVHQKYAPKTVLVKIAPIKSFYEKFGIEIPKKSVTVSETPETLRENGKITKKSDIEKVLENDKVSSLMKCIILGQTSSGLLPVDILQLTIGQYEKGKTTIQKSITDKDGNEKLVDVTLCKLVVRRQKNKNRNGHEFVTFFSPETCSKIDTYLQQRNTSPVLDGELKDFDIDSYLKQEKRNNSTYNKYIAYLKQRYDIDSDNGKSEDDLLLFINQTVDNEFLKNRDEKYRKISSGGIQKMYYAACEDSGMLAPKHQRNKITGQKMRSFFSDTLINKTSKPNLVKHMMGHKAGAVENAYYRPHQEKLQSFYVGECLPLLQFIETESIRLLDKDFLRLQSIEAENKEIRIEMEIKDVIAKCNNAKLQHEIMLRLNKPELTKAKLALQLLIDGGNQKQIDIQQHRVDELQSEVDVLESEIKRLDAACQQEIQEIEERYGLKYEKKPMLNIRPLASIPDEDESDDLYDVDIKNLK